MKPIVYCGHILRRGWVRMELVMILTFYSGIQSFNIALNSCHIPMDDPDHVALFSTSTEFGVAVWNF